MKTALAFVVSWLLCSGLLWSVFAFGSLAANPLDWPTLTRWVFAVLAVVITGRIASLVFDED